MTIEFSDHASKQLINRPRIKRSMVSATINQPEKIYASYRGRRLYQKRFNGEVLEVVAIEEHNKLIVITQYFLEQA